jgi:hypothetical protein
MFSRQTYRPPAVRAADSAPARPGPRIRARLRVGPVDDPLEQEADRAADAVLHGNRGAVAGIPNFLVQRNCAACSAGEDKDTVRREPRGQPGAVPAAADAAAVSGVVAGRPLPPEQRAYFEPRFGRDFGGVLIADGPAAQASAEALGARAFTLGRTIVFAHGEYDPGSMEGKRLIAHELAHVVQAPDNDTVHRQPDDEPEESVPVRAGLVMNMSELCGPDGCFDDSRIYGELERSRAEDVAAEARATAERKRRRDIRAHGSKQQKWELEFEDHYHRYKGVGAVAGLRDDGIMTPTGVRVPAQPGDYLSPRPFYERRNAAFLAWQGFIHYAEIVEAGHDAAARELALKTNRGFPLRDDQLDLAAYTKWSYKAKTTREAVEAAILLASGITAVQQVLARSTAGTFARNFAGIANTPAAANGARMTVEGVAFGGVRVARTGGEYFTSYDMIVNVGRVHNQGKAMHAAFELGTVQAARQAGATTARVGVSNVVNPAWAGHLKAQGYWWEMIPVGPNRYTGFWTRVFRISGG